MVTEKKTKVVYLDQNCWIDIAKLSCNQPSQEKKELLEKILASSEEGRMIYPLSISHLDETLRIRNSKRKSQLASLMATLSKGYSLQPYLDAVIETEIRNIALRKSGMSLIDIRNFVLGKGVSHLIGAKPEISFKNNAIDPSLVKKLEKKLMDALEDPKTFELILKLSPPQDLGKGIEEAIQKTEKIRQDLRQVKDNNRRWKAFLAINLTEFILPKLAKVLFELGLPPDFIIKRKASEKDIMEFLDNIPTALCFFTLIFKRDQQFQRPIRRNDFNDIWFLTLAIPYCDIVVTEKMFASLANQAHLDKECNTAILSSITALKPYL